MAKSPEVFGFREPTASILQGMARGHGLRPRGRIGIKYPPIGVQTNGGYFAKVPVSGIPARSGDTPGQATCEIYKIIQETGGNTIIDAGFAVEVFNVFPIAIPFNAALPYFNVHQDQFGRWLNEAPNVSESEDHYAWLIGFTITNTTGGLMKTNNDQMAATVDYILDGLTPPVVGGEIIVHDDQEVCPNAIAGAQGWAFRNEHLGSEENPYYQILVCNQMCRQARAVLDQTMDGLNDFEVNIRNFFPDDESPEGLDAIEPFRSIAFNPLSRSAPNGFNVRLRLGFCTDPANPFAIPRFGYIIESVEVIYLDMPVNFRVNQSTKAIEVQRRQMAVESHQTEQANQPWEPMLQHKNCT